MLHTDDVSLQSLVLHRVGNKHNEENISFADSALEVGEDVSQLLLHYFLNPFKEKEYYNLSHDTDLMLNEVYTYVSEIFEKPSSLYDVSLKLAQHLYDKSTHPKIKAGDFYTVFFKDCIVDGLILDAVGIFKSESKETFLKVYPSGSNYEIESESGININKLDKGVMIYNVEKENGYMLSVVDNSGRGSEARFWTEEFLNVVPRRDEYYYTQSAITMCKEFVTSALAEDLEISKPQQADLLQKSMSYFKENDNFDLDNFAEKVIEKPQIIEKFKNYKDEYSEDKNITIKDSFEISDNAVKKQEKNMKSIIKLDKNFHIYIHGDTKLIDKGRDPVTGLNYYRFMYQNEY